MTLSALVDNGRDAGEPPAVATAVSVPVDAVRADAVEVRVNSVRAVRSLAASALEGSTVGEGEDGGGAGEAAAADNADARDAEKGATTAVKDAMARAPVLPAPNALRRCRRSLGLGRAAWTP